MFYFFKKKYQEQFWIALAFLSYNLRYGVIIFSWQIVIPLSRFGSASNILSFAFLMSENISQSSVNLKVFTSVTSSRTSLFFSLQPLSSFMSVNVLSRVPSGAYPESQNQSTINIPMISYFFSNSICTGFEFHFQSYHFHFFCCVFIFVVLFSLLSICFYKLSCRFITRRQGGNPSTHLLPVPELNNRSQRPVTEKMWKTRCDWSLMVTHICYSPSALQTEELAAKCVLYAMIHS